MTTAKQTKIRVHLPSIEVVSFEVTKVHKGSKGDGEQFVLAKRSGTGKGSVKWMRFWHKGREIRKNDSLVCTVIADVDTKGRDCYRIISIQAIYPGGV